MLGFFAFGPTYALLAQDCSARMMLAGVALSRLGWKAQQSQLRKTRNLIVVFPSDVGLIKR